jgi:tRNA-Thr(GGU) m(6)t(6)A37 methyltransferase TsaA
MEKELRFIGYVDTPYNSVTECPHNINFNGPLCRLVINDEYKEGIEGLAPKQNILILYWLDGAERTRISQINPHSESKAKQGTFSLRSPHRPNPIGAAVTPIVKIEDGEITVKGLDCLNGTKLLDIKPAIKLENGGNISDMGGKSA